MQATAAGHGVTGRHIVLNVERGAAVNLYSDQNRTILAYMEVPYINMHSQSWFVINWGLADLGPKFDPLNMHAHRSRAANIAAAISSAPRKHPQLTRTLHLVQNNEATRQLRTRVWRRLRNFVSRGMCIGGELPENLRAQSTAKRTPTMQVSNQDRRSTAQHDAADPAAPRISEQDRSENNPIHRSQALTATQTGTAAPVEEGDEEAKEDASSESDVDHTQRLKEALMARTRSMNEDVEGLINTAKRASGSRATIDAPPQQVCALMHVCTMHEVKLQV